MMNKKWHGVILCSLVLLLIVSLSAGIVGISFAGTRIVRVSEPQLRVFRIRRQKR